MQVRMKRKILSPGVEYSDHSCICTKMFFVVSKITDHTPSSVEEKVIHYSRLIQAKFVECFGKCEYYMKISCWKQLRFPGLYPPLALYLLALRTVSIAAGVVTDANVAAGST
jgi:hypothetical protein